MQMPLKKTISLHKRDNGKFYLSNFVPDSAVDLIVKEEHI